VSERQARIERLRRSDLPVDPVELARFLIGTLIVHDLPEGRVVGRIVETEAYLPNDPASHCYRGRTPRNGSMFLDHGIAYVYQIYGTSFCFNVSAEVPDTGAGVLVRAVEPVGGAELMRMRRGGVAERELARGPGKLTVALGIRGDHDGVDLCGDGDLWLGRLAGAPPATVGTSVRIGLTKAADEVLRFYEVGSAFVSGPRRLSP
jgi:DNA-3-methyladenine glycosylase